MNISMPWSLAGRFFKWIWSKITRLWLLKTYQKSHEYKAKRLRLGARWEPLGKYLEYSLRLSSSADHETVKSRVAFRAKEMLLENVTLYFEASGHGIRYQQKIELVNLDQSVLIVNLDQIPQQELMEVSERGIFFSITEIQFIQCVITLSGGCQQQPFDSKRFSLTYSWFLNDKWVRRWGELWNCNAIEHAKTEIKSYWRWRLGEFRHFSLYDDEIEPYSLNGILRKSLCIFLINHYMITVQFWLAIHSGWYVLGDGKLKFNQRRIRKAKSSKASNI
ncbi:hypothetical protein [Erwinia psidii]|uniref:Uncharacterized protein n=1 Tax=Erwinia psidii TaxID=69224 RepID=A0A3N6TRT3_9GAMM|nr:hypothetical protein [Erwinia psidii]MCX8956988.1 hypothetical protein [Erwinia psidii]MCX8965248.1 hypothetical protein [Erwinia psidii]RQM37952.1 hypothetical protein EB241_11745 [Erwinia psidii]